MERDVGSAQGDSGPEALAEVLRALGDATRLCMLALLRRRPFCVCELAALFPISQPAVSGHLRRLRAAGLVVDQRRGMWVYYRLADPLPDVAAAALRALRLPAAMAAAASTDPASCPVQPASGDALAPPPRSAAVAVQRSG